MERVLPTCKRKKRIFIFDRDSTFIEALSLFFQGTHEVYGFGSIDDIKHNELAHPDVILLDIFPLISTQELEKVIMSMKAIYHKIPILLTSTSGNTLRKAKSVGIHDFLEKPFDVEILQRKISSLGK